MRSIFIIIITVISFRCFALEITLDPDYTFETRGNNKLRLFDYETKFDGNRFNLLHVPVKIRSRDEQRLYLFAGIGLSLYALDSRINDRVQDSRSHEGDEFLKSASYFGKDVYPSLAMGGVFLYGKYTANTRLQRMAIYTVQSQLLSGVITSSIKGIGGRSRPNAGLGARDWNSFDSDDPSFPSNHTTNAFAVATSIAEEYKDKKWVPILAYGAATLTAVSRVNDKKHWASDVFVGALIGHYTAKFVRRLHEDGDNESSDTSPNSEITLFPSTQGDAVMLNLQVRF